MFGRADQQRCAVLDKDIQTSDQQEWPILE